MENFFFIYLIFPSKNSANVFLPDQYECPVNVRPFQYYKASNMIEWMGNWTNSEVFINAKQKIFHKNLSSIY